MFRFQGFSDAAGGTANGSILAAGTDHGRGSITGAADPTTAYAALTGTGSCYSTARFKGMHNWSVLCPPEPELRTFR